MIEAAELRKNTTPELLQAMEIIGRILDKRSLTLTQSTCLLVLSQGYVTIARKTMDVASDVMLAARKIAG